MKECKLCKRLLPLSSFYRNGERTTSRCRSCAKSIARTRYRMKCTNYLRKQIPREEMLDWLDSGEMEQMKEIRPIVGGYLVIYKPIREEGGVE